MARSIAALLELLGPFDSEPPTKEEARSKLLEMAQAFQEADRDSIEAPRRGEVAAELRSIAAKADDLLAALESASPYTTGTIEGDIGGFGLLGMSDDEPLTQYRHLADAHPFDPEGTPSSYAPDHWRRAPGGWLDRLYGMRELANRAASIIPPDTGGRGNVHKDRFGSPILWLVGEAMWLFSECRPRDARVAGGDLLAFTGQLLEFAGDGKYDAEKVKPYLGRVVTWFRWRDAMTARVRDIQLLLANAGVARIGREEERQLRAELLEKMQRLAMEHPPSRLLDTDV